MCGASHEVPKTSFLSGMVQDKYWVLHKVGEGNISETYVAKILENDRKIFMKVMSRVVSKDRQAIERFFNNLSWANKLGSKRILPVLETGELYEHFYSIHPYIHGTFLDDRVENDGPMAEKEALRIVSQIAKIMNQVWEDSRAVHGDIRPSNIIIDEDDKVHLTDFGNAKQLLVSPEVRFEQMNMNGDLFNYMAPEQVRGLPPEHCAGDIYSLGVTLFYLLTGQSPTKDTDPYQTIQEVEDVRDYRSDISEGTAGLILTMMREPGAKPYQSWREFLKDLRTVTKTKSKMTRLRTSGRHSEPVVGAIDDLQKRNRSNNKVLLIAAILAGIALLLLPVFALVIRAQSDTPTPQPNPPPATPEAAPSPGNWNARNFLNSLPQDLRRHLAVYLPLDEGAGNNVGGLIAPVQGTHSSGSWVSSAHGRALSFSPAGGSSNGASIQIPSVQSANAVTLSFWFYTTRLSRGNPPSRNTLIAWRSSTGQARFSILELTDSTGKRGVSAEFGSGVATYNERSRNQWVHLVVTYDGASVRIYRNGKEMDHSSSSGQLGLSTGDVLLLAPAPNRLRGGLDEIQCYSTALTPAQVKILHNTYIR